MPVVAVIGLQWGDEGKGKIVDVLSKFASFVVRFQGGSNAGHTIKTDGKKVVLGLIPSGIFRESCSCVLSGGMVIDPLVLLDEIEMVRQLGVKVDETRLHISNSAHVVLPVHKLVDEILESKGEGRIGTTKRGIGPAYQDKIGRRGVRMFELLDEKKLVDGLRRIHYFWMRFCGDELEGKGGVNIDDVVDKLLAIGEEISPFLSDTVMMLNEEISKGSRILFEGAQGTLLDIDHGTYPFVTSSNASIGGAISGVGVAPGKIDCVIGISKAYATRVGEGPFPTEASEVDSQILRNEGGEYGSMTGRPRRCGWLDIPAIRRNATINGVHLLAITKLDVLSRFSHIPVCVGYKVNGRRVDYLPIYNLDKAEPVYETWQGWNKDIRNVRAFEDLPPNARKYIKNIEIKTDLKVSIISVGPARSETIVIENPFE